MTLRLSAAARASVVADARRARPAECCGILIGRPGEIVEAVATGNLSPDPSRFLIDPKGHIDARRGARAKALEVVGFYHSHPHSAAVPSPLDLDEVTYPDHLYLIVGLADPDAPEIRVYRMAHGQFVELALAE